jgi:hypothetical protein
MLHALADDDFSLRCTLASDVAPGAYSVFVHNGFGGQAGWASAGQISVQAAAPWPSRVFNVMDFYGANADREEARTAHKGSPPVDRTEAVAAALKKAGENGGGVVYFPAGVYTLQAPLQAPPHTMLRGQGMGLVTLWWGKGDMALDGGSSQRRLNAADSAVPPTMISGSEFGIEDLTLVLPRLYQTGIETGDGFRMRQVRMRVDRYWIRSGEREYALAMRLGNKCQITDCDILARGVAFTSGRGLVVARNQIMAGKSNADLSHSNGVIVEDNSMVSLDPTAYINMSGEGRNLYYARNRHEAFFSQQSDFSWTFDGTGMAYIGKVASVNGTAVQLAGDPKYPNWAGEDSGLWKRSVICILQGRGAGQYRYVAANHGRQWTVDRPFDVAPDATSIVSIVPFRGHALVIGNHFEDCGWVNMGYGSSFNVVCAGNQLYRVGEMLNLGLRLSDSVMPSWYIQYLDNDIYDGQTLVQCTGDQRSPQTFDGPVTRFCVQEGQHIHADNTGSLDVGGNATDVIVEHCILDSPESRIRVDQGTSNVLIRDNRVAAPAADAYQGSGLGKAVVVH